MDEQLKAYFGKYLAEHFCTNNNETTIHYWNFKPESQVLADLQHLFPHHTFRVTRMYDAAAIRYTLLQMAQAELESLTDPILMEKMDNMNLMILLVA